MATVKDIYDCIDKFAPFNTALPFDNSGLLIGGYGHKVKGCVITLDLTKEVLAFAKEKQINLIITHHPVIFGGIDAVLSDTVLYDAIASGINIISAHTNLDLAKEGVNYALAKALCLSDLKPFINSDMIGLVGTLQKEYTADEFAVFLKERLSFGINYVDAGKPIKTVALVGGAGSDYLFDSVSQADAYLTGEVKHHIYTYAKNSGINLFAVGHYASEVIFADVLKEKLENAFEDVSFHVFDDRYIKCV